MRSLQVFFRFSISFTVSSFLPTCLQSFHSFVEFPEIVYFSVLHSFTNRSLYFKTSGMIVSTKFWYSLACGCPAYVISILLIQREYNVFCWFISVITEVVWKQWIVFNGFVSCVFRVTARYIMKKRVLAASPCGDPISLPVLFSSFTDICTSSSSKWIRWSSLFSRVPFRSLN